MYRFIYQIIYQATLNLYQLIQLLKVMKIMAQFKSDFRLGYGLALQPLTLFLYFHPLEVLFQGHHFIYTALKTHKGENKWQTQLN